MSIFIDHVLLIGEIKLNNMYINIYLTLVLNFYIAAEREKIKILLFTATFLVELSRYFCFFT
jgi:hypothetical protein